MYQIIRDRYVLFSLASVLIIVFVCAIGSFNADSVNGNGITEMEGVISDPFRSPNGTTFKLTDLDGNEQRCFYNSAMPEMPVLCRLVGSLSSDGNMFFVSNIIVSGAW